jgi:hypothetical protein
MMKRAVFSGLGPLVRRMNSHTLLPLCALALSACEEPTTPTAVAADVQPAFAAAPAACRGQITSIIANTWPFAHADQDFFAPPPGSIALWLQEVGEPFFGISTVRELQSLFCGSGSNAMATGSGHFVDPRGGPDAGEPALRNFSFVAHSNGGQFQVVNRTFDIRLRGSIECVNVVGNEAWFAGIVTESTRPELIPAGSFRVFYVVDNGEGRGGADQIAHSVRLTRVPPQTWCDVTPRRTLLDIEQGNIQVH